MHFQLKILLDRHKRGSIGEAEYHQATLCPDIQIAVDMQTSKEEVAANALRCSAKRTTHMSLAFSCSGDLRLKVVSRAIMAAPRHSPDIEMCCKKAGGPDASYIKRHLCPDIAGCSS